MLRTWMLSSMISLLVVACSYGPQNFDEDEDGAGANGDQNGEGQAGKDPTQPGLCPTGKSHVGFGNVDFASGRVEGGIGSERRRIKPYTAMRTEFERALGQVPASVNASKSAYGDDANRWYSEPVAGAVSLYTTYSNGFTGCYDSMTDAKYNQMPTTETAQSECTAMQRKYWQRAPSVEETAACVDLVSKALTSESSARRRWAHACASVLTSAGFISY